MANCDMAVDKTTDNDFTKLLFKSTIQGRSVINIFVTTPTD